MPVSPARPDGTPPAAAPAALAAWLAEELGAGALVVAGADEALSAARVPVRAVAAPGGLVGS